MTSFDAETDLKPIIIISIGSNPNCTVCWLVLGLTLKSNSNCNVYWLGLGLTLTVPYIGYG